MAAVTIASTQEGEGLIRVFKFDSVATGSTFVWDTHTTADAPPPQAWWIENTEDAAKVTATYSAGTFTFTVSAGDPAISLFVLIGVSK